MTIKPKREWGFRDVVMYILRPNIRTQITEKIIIALLFEKGTKNGNPLSNKIWTYICESFK